MTKASQLSFNLDETYENDRSVLNALFQHSSRYRQSSAYYQLMRFIARFPQYSPYNCMLLHIQNPDMTYVATPNQWWKRFKRRVKPDARPLLILAPNCPVLFVYDLSDTQGEDLPSQIQDPFETHAEIKGKVWGCTIENCLRDGIIVDTNAQYSFVHAGTAFRLRSSNRILKERVDEPFDFLIKINEELGLSARYATLVHELGHIYSGHLGNRDGDWWQDRSRTGQKQAEIEAESISYLVCTRRGLETKSAEYMALFAHEYIDLPPVSMDVVLSATYHIEQMGARELPDRSPK